MTNKPPRFIILVTGWNCKPYVRDCFRSIIQQNYKNFKAVFLFDSPTDGSWQEFLSVQEEFPDERIVGHYYERNEGAAKRRYDALQIYGDKNDIVLLLGADDRLFAYSLSRIVKEYESGKWMTYGNWIDQFKKRLPRNFLFFDKETHDLRDYRKVKYRSTAPNTFYKFLFDRIPEEDFKLDGKWIDSTTESEVMFSCLEMCGESRIGVITEAIYHYNSRLPNGTLRRQGSEYKYAIYNRIITRPKRELLTDKDFGI